MEPKIRFKGFSNEWEAFTLDRICKKASSILSENSLGDNFGKYPVYGASGYIQNITTYDFDREYVGLIKDGSGVGRSQLYPAFSSILGTMQYILPKDDTNVSFLSYLLQTIDFSIYVTGSSIPHIYFKDYCKEVTRIPLKEEQKEIANYFKNLDSLIQSTSRKIDLLKQVKAASLQSMFPQSGEAAPRVRFKEYANKWKTCKLNSILTERHEASTITQELPQLSFTIADGVIRPEDRKSNQRDFLIKDKDNKRYLITRVGDIIYNPANVVYGAIHRNSLIDGVVSPIYRIFYTNQDSRFIECVVRRPSFINQLAMRTEGTVTKLKTLKPEAFLDMTVCIPTDIEEQKAIGEYFRNLDQQIILQAKRLDKLKQIKSACLDNMFV